MGCRLFRPLTEVERDPTVSYIAAVGSIVVLHELRPTTWNTCCNGVIYIKDGSLYYDAKIGKYLLGACLKKHFKLCDIHSVDVIDHQTVYLRHRQGNRSGRGRGRRGGGGPSSIVLRPGVKICLGASTVVYVAVQEAEELARQLVTSSGLEEVETEDDDYL